MSWYPCKCCRFCRNCSNLISPYAWQVNIYGIVACDPAVCPDCENLDGTYVLTWADYCSWQYDLPAPICRIAKVSLDISSQVMIPPFSWSIAVNLLDADGLSLLWSQKSYSSIPNCITTFNESLGPFYPIDENAFCDVSNSDVSIAAFRECWCQG
jgi:hypothetical protein